MATLTPTQKEYLDAILRADTYVQYAGSYRDYLKTEEIARKVTGESVDYLIEHSYVERDGRAAYFRTTKLCGYSADSCLSLFMLLYQCRVCQDKIRRLDWHGIRAAYKNDPNFDRIDIAALDASTDYWDLMKYLDREADDEYRLRVASNSGIPVEIRDVAAKCIESPEAILRALMLTHESGRPMITRLPLLLAVEALEPALRERLIAQSEHPEELDELINKPHTLSDAEAERKWKEYRKENPR